MDQDALQAQGWLTRRAVPVCIGHEDPHDGKREYIVQWIEHGDGAEWNEYSIWAHTGADAMRDCYERHGLNITVVVGRPL
jgi:hypothetical protein